MRILLLVPFLAACATTGQVPCADIPVFEKPKIEMPLRPVLRSDGNGSDGEVVRRLHQDVVNLMDYSTQLENVIKPLK